MKSRVTNDNQIVLSIGMIVKNEEKVLRRCLEALKPLREAINCELIIADTGSTDSTFDIAKEYADIAYHFEWINDFAAARNSTLEKAHGIWYMFIDADEYFDEDMSEMIKFFSYSQLQEKYNSLQIYIRNYSNEEKTDYLDVRLPRVFRRKKDTKFVGKIHETIAYELPAGYFSTILHHTGYIYTDDKSFRKKKERNLPYLKKEYEKDPTNYRTLCHLLDASTLEKDNLRKYIEEAMSLLKNDNKNIYSNILYMQCANNSENDPEYAIHICDEYFEKRIDSEKYIVALSMHYIKANMLLNLFKYDESYYEIKNYVKLYKKYLQSELIDEDLTMHPVIGATEREYQKILMNFANRYILLKNEYAKNLLSDFNVSILDDDIFKLYIDVVQRYCFESEKYSLIFECFNSANINGKINRKAYIIHAIESIYAYSDTEEKRRNFVEQSVKYNIDSPYFNSLKFLLNSDDKNYDEKLLDYINNVIDWTECSTEIIFLAIKKKINLSSAVRNMKLTEYCAQIELLANTHKDFAEVVLEYDLEDGFTDSIKQFYWLVDIYGEAVYRAKELSNEKKYRLYNRFVSLLSDYVLNVYNPEVLNDEDLEILPNLHKFGYHMSQANACLINGDNIGYIRGLRKALNSCESMKEIVQFMLEQFRKTI